MTNSETMFKNLSELEKAIVQCKKCDRLVTFREKVAKEKRKSFMHWDYWGKAVPGYGNPNAKIMILGLAQQLMVVTELEGCLLVINLQNFYLTASTM